LSAVLLLDHSAWSRRRQPLARERIVAGLEGADLGVCLPFLLEAGYSAVSARELDGLVADLAELPRVEITPDVERCALQAQRELASVGHHRLPPADIIIAACAHEAGAGVLHYDRDYDLIAKHTSLEFESEWLVPAGTL
jgi:predicted nucleic acid-binding protein